MGQGKPLSPRRFQLRVAFTSRGKRKYCADKGWLGCDLTYLPHFTPPQPKLKPACREMGVREPPSLSFDSRSLLQLRGDPSHL